MNKKIEQITKGQPRNSFPAFRAGNTIQVFMKIKEEGKTRIQMFEGVVMRIQGKGVSKSFTVRRISYGEGVERTFLFNSPNIDKVKVAKKGKAKRAKLYYMRDKIGKKTKVDEKEGAGEEGPVAGTPPLPSSEAQVPKDDASPREEGPK